MTLEDRITKIEQVAKKRQDTEQAAMLKNIKTHNDLIMQAEALLPRINDLIHIANKCDHENIEFPTDRQCEHYGYGNGKCNFIANSIRHNLGFIQHMNHNITEIGILRTGASEADITSDGNTITIYCGNKRKIKPDIIAKDTYDENETPMVIDLLNKLCNEFDNLETSFYEWIDNLS